MNTENCDSSIPATTRMPVIARSSKPTESDAAVAAVKASGLCESGCNLIGNSTARSICLAACGVL